MWWSALVLCLCVISGVYGEEVTLRKEPAPPAPREGPTNAAAKTKLEAVTRVIDASLAEYAEASRQADLRIEQLRLEMAKFERRSQDLEAWRKLVQANASREQLLEVFALFLVLQLPYLFVSLGLVLGLGAVYRAWQARHAKLAAAANLAPTQ